MAIIFFIIWLLTTNQICPNLIKFAKVVYFFPNTKYTHKSLHKIFESLPKGQNFTKSGHTASEWHWVCFNLRVTGMVPEPTPTSPRWRWERRGAWPRLRRPSTSCPGTTSDTSRPMTQKKVNLTHENIVIKFVQFNLF